MHVDAENISTSVQCVNCNLYCFMVSGAYKSISVGEEADFVKKILILFIYSIIYTQHTSILQVLVN